nr:hypothetical protein [Tanacetum cinerariifolium]
IRAEIREEFRTSSGPSDAGGNPPQKKVLWFDLIPNNILIHDDSEVIRYDGDECDKGRMLTKIELTLEQSQQGVSNDVLEEVYVSQPNGFVDPDNPNHVYKLKKALYGLKQAPSVWYDMLSSFLISQDFSKGVVDPTLFIHRNGNHLLLWILPWWKNPNWMRIKKAEAVDLSHYHGMIGTLLYLTASRHDLQFAICMCAWYQARPTEKHLHAIKRSFGIYEEPSIEVYGIRSLGFNKIPMYCDNKSAIALCSNTVQHPRLKHIDIRYHFIKEQVENRVIELYFVNTEYQPEDIFTKVLGKERIEFLINKLGMRSFMSETLKQLKNEVDD